MKIRNIRAVNMPPTPRGFRTIAKFEFEPIDGVVIYDCILVIAPDGRLLTYGPVAKNDAPILTMRPEIREEIISIARQGTRIINDQYSSAA